MTQDRAQRRPPESGTTRTDRDWVMILLGTGLIAVFLIGGYMSLSLSDDPAVPKIRGPVKDPKKMGLWEPSGQNNSGMSTFRHVRAFGAHRAKSST